MGFRVWGLADSGQNFGVVGPSVRLAVAEVARMPAYKY